MMNMSSEYPYVEIGEKLQQVIKERGFTYRGLARLLHDAMGISETAARYQLSEFGSGFLFGATHEQGKTVNRIFPARLSAICYSCGIEDTSSLIKSVRKVDPDFTYPPARGISYDEAIRLIPIKNSSAHIANKKYHDKIERKLQSLNPRFHKIASGLINALYEQQQGSENASNSKGHAPSFVFTVAKRKEHSSA